MAIVKKKPGRKPKFGENDDDIARFVFLLRDFKRSEMGLEAYFLGEGDSKVRHHERLSPTGVVKTATRLGVLDELPRPKARLTNDLKARTITRQRRQQMPLEVAAYRAQVKESTVRTWARELKRPLKGNTPLGRRAWWDKYIFAHMPAPDDLEGFHTGLFCKDHEVPPYLLTQAWYEKHPDQPAALWDIAGNDVDTEPTDEEAYEAIEELRPCEPEAATMIVWVDQELHYLRHTDDEVLDDETDWD